MSARPRRPSLAHELIGLVRQIGRAETRSLPGLINLFGLLLVGLAFLATFIQSSLIDAADRGLVAAGKTPPPSPDPLAGLIWLVVAMAVCVSLLIVNQRLNPPGS